MHYIVNINDRCGSPGIKLVYYFSPSVCDVVHNCLSVEMFTFSHVGL